MHGLGDWAYVPGRAQGAGLKLWHIFQAGCDLACEWGAFVADAEWRLREVGLREVHQQRVGFRA